MKVRIAPRASREVDAILDYLACQSPSAVAGFAARLDGVLVGIAEFPWTGRVTNRANIRFINTSPYPYLVFYRVSRVVVEVVAVRHGARNPKSMPAKPR
jgi:toxin ParE1/3/4